MLLAIAVPCPGCGEAVDLDQPIYTSWGGFLLPRLIHHTVCGRCGMRYNGRTGTSNQRAITAVMLTYIALWALVLGLLVTLVVLSTL